jgi:predicted pyridoxine 5'-phosphate oxidase superfamily flavin-nucleotide-binding protein
LARAQDPAHLAGLAGDQITVRQAADALMDYAQRRRIKLRGRARVGDDPALIARLMPEGYRARGEQAVLFEIAAWDVNCPRHIPQKIDAADVAAARAQRDARIAELEAELAGLKTQLSTAIR